jgi:hypothetical protein
VWFIDDQPYFLDEVHEQYAKIRTLQMMRPEGRVKSDVTATSLHRKVSCMNDIVQIVDVINL